VDLGEWVQLINYKVSTHITEPYEKNRLRFPKQNENQTTNKAKHTFLKLVYYVASVATLLTVFVTSKRTSSVNVECPNNVKEEYRHLISIVLITKGLIGVCSQ